jgi:hypothetical protein
MKRITYGLIAIMLSFFLVSCQQPSNNENASTANLNQAPQNPFLGAWELDQFSNQDTSWSIEGPSIILFGEDYYSWMASKPGRKNFENIAEPTDEEVREAFNTITAISGVYEFSDSTMTMTQKIVKRPNWMNPSRVEHYAYQLNGDEVHLHSRYRILEGVKSPPENPFTIVLKKK